MEFYNPKDMCMPAKVYFALALVAVIMTSITAFDFSNIVFSIVVLILWSLLLNWICSIVYNII